MRRTWGRAGGRGAFVGVVGEGGGRGDQSSRKEKKGWLMSMLCNLINEVIR